MDNLFIHQPGQPGGNRRGPYVIKDLCNTGRCHLILAPPPLGTAALILSRLQSAVLRGSAGQSLSAQIIPSRNPSRRQASELHR